MDTRKSGQSPEPIAVIGLSCRLPGGCNDAGAFWRYMSARRNAWSKTPAHRYNEGQYRDPSTARLDTFNHSGGHFLEQDVYDFDASFFSITTAEAIAMDPQQRMNLECAYEALENAGMPLEKVAGTPVGVYAAGSPAGYRDYLIRDMETGPMFQGVGNHASIQANRISYVFDLRGPSISLDTACSSGLIALHVAVKALRDGDCTSALVGGANLSISPATSVELSRLKLLNPAGRCYSFDERGKDGFGRGEGAAFLVLKPLSKARRDGDLVRAVIRETGANSDGRSAGMTSPSPVAQADLIRSTYASAGLDPLETPVIEAHGTGTAVGDPIEAKALADAFRSTARPTPLLIGSAKSNFGHLESVSGFVAVIKAILMVEKKLLAPTADFKQPKKSIDFAGLNLRVIGKSQLWPSKALRRVSISNYGFGGANGHVIIEAADSVEFTFETISLSLRGNALPRPVLYVLSGRQKKVVEQQRAQLYEFVRMSYDKVAAGLYGLAFTLDQRRSRLKWRTAVVASSFSELSTAFSDPTAPVSSDDGRQTAIAWVFTGQGAQSARMSFELLDHFPVYRESIMACDRVVKALGCTWSILQALSEPHESTKVYSAEVSQPVCTAVQIALVDLLHSWKLMPCAVVGHSSGEIAAAYAAGALSLKDGMAIAYHRGLVAGTSFSSESTRPGLMAALGTDADTAKSLIDSVNQSAGKAVVACYNSPGSVTISGDKDAVSAVEQEAKKRSIFARALKVDVAYHSHHMLGSRSHAYSQAISTIKPQQSSTNVKFYSSVSAELLEDTSVLDAQYWVSNMVSSVKFMQALTKLAQDLAPTQVLEVGPHSLLKGPISQTLRSMGEKAVDIQYLPSLVRGEGISPLLGSMGKLWEHGVALDISAINQYPGNGSTVDCQLLGDLPPYPWSRSRFLHDSRLCRTLMASKFPKDSLLGERIHQTSDTQPSWRNVLRTQNLGWTLGHKFRGEALLPYSGFVYMASEAARQLAQAAGSTFDSFVLKDITVTTPINMSAEDGIEVVTSLRSTGPHSEVDPMKDAFFEISSCSQGTWTRNGSGTVRIVDSKNTKDAFRSDLAAFGQQGPTLRCDRGKYDSGSIESLYNSLSDLGIEYSEDFALLRSMQFDDEHSGRGIVELRMPDNTSETPVLHPCILDALGHICWGPLCAGNSVKRTLVPVSVGSCYVPFEAGSASKAGRTLTVSGTGKPTGDAAGTVVFSFATNNGIIVEDMVMQPYGSVQTSGSSTSAPDCLQTVWVPSLDLLSLPDRQSLLQKPEGCASVLREYVRMSGYNRPEARAAYLGAPSDELLGALVKGLAPPPGTTRVALCGKLDYASPYEEDVKTAKDKLVQFEPAVQFSLLASWTDFSSAAATYDLMVIAFEQAELHEVASVLKAATSAAKPGADIIWSTKSLDLKQLESSLELSSLNGECACISDTSRSNTAVYLTKVNESFRVEENSSSKTRVLFASKQLCATTSDRVAELLCRDIPGCDAAAESLVDFDPSKTSQGETALILDLGPESTLAHLDEAAMSSIKSLASTKGLMWVTRNFSSKFPSQHMVTGLARVLRIERPDLRVITLNFEGHVEDELMDACIVEVFKKTILSQTPTVDNEFNFVDGRLLVQRLIPNTAVHEVVKQEQGFEFKHEQPWSQGGRALTLKKPANHDLNSISFVDDPCAGSVLEDHEVEIKVEAVGANFKDTLILLGQIKEGAVGGECSGTVAHVGGRVSTLQVGDKVAALAPWSYGHLTRCSEYTAIRVPPTMSFSAAATLPISFCTAHYALHHLARISHGESVLIHAGAGALGQAAIMLAQAAGAIVYTTVGSEEKRSLLMREYGIPECNIFYSRNTSFKKGLMTATNGRGVDIVLNSLAGDKLHASWDCVAAFGRMVEVGKRDILSNSSLGMKNFGPNVSFTAFDLGDVAAQKPRLFQKTFEDVMSILSRSGGSVRPVRPITTVAFSEMAQALRLLGSGKTSGKVVVCPKDGDRVMAAAPGLPRTVFRPDASYLITGGTGGVGLELCKWMARDGAKHIILASRRGLHTPGVKDTIEAIEATNEGVHVHVPICDISKAQDVQSLVANLARYGEYPIRGIFHGAVVLKDVIMDRMTASDWHKVLQPKVDGGWNMHKYISSPPLDFFVMLSSVSHLHGAPSQGSYCAAGGYLEGLAHHRRSLGLSADVLELGIITDVGVFEANKEAYKSRIDKVFGHVIPPAQVAAACKAAVMARLPIPTPIGVIAQPPGAGMPDWMTDARFSLLRAQDDPTKAEGAGGAEEPLLLQCQKALGSRDAFCGIAKGAVVRKMSALLTLPTDDIGSATPLTDLGIDSLVAIELRTWIWKEMGVRVVNSDLLGGASVAGLVEKLAENAGAGKE